MALTNSSATPALMLLVAALAVATVQSAQVKSMLSTAERTLSSADWTFDSLCGLWFRPSNSGNKYYLILENRQRYVYKPSNDMFYEKKWKKYYKTNERPIPDNCIPGRPQEPEPETPAPEVNPAGGFENEYDQSESFSTAKWDVGDGVAFSGTPDAAVFIQYAATAPQDWGSMDEDARNVWEWAVRYGVAIYDSVIHTNNHNKVTNELVFNSLSEFRSSFTNFLRTAVQRHLVFTFSGHGIPYQYTDEFGILVQGEEIQIGQGIMYKDVDLAKDINLNLPRGKFLWLVIDTCFSGGLLNLWQIKNRLDRNVILFAGANSEIVGWGDQVEGGYLTRNFVRYAQPGRYACHIADDILEHIEWYDQERFRQTISTQVKYSRPVLAVAPLFVA